VMVQRCINNLKLGSAPLLHPVPTIRNERLSDQGILS